MIKLFVEGGFAMYPLLLLSIIAVAITIERFVYLRKARTDTGKFMDMPFHEWLLYTVSESRDESNNDQVRLTGS